VEKQEEKEKGRRFFSSSFYNNHTERKLLWWMYDVSVCAHLKGTGFSSETLVLAFTCIPLSAVATIDVSTACSGFQVDVLFLSLTIWRKRNTRVGAKE
jgi:hypothetical protein